jgi:hypothetical protein
MFTGNRGCVVDDNERVVRHHAGTLWIICQTEFRGWRVALARPRRWTPLFFLDDAVALAAGHRPCATCRRADYLSYRDAVTAALERDQPVRAWELNHLLNAERLSRGQGLDRGCDRKIWTSAITGLPDGTIVIDEAGEARLIVRDRLLRFTFDGWTEPIDRPEAGDARVLTPPTSVAALANGFRPTLHHSAG